MHITSTETQYAPPLEILLLKVHYAHGKCMGYHLIQANHFLGLPCEFLLVKKLEIEKTKITFNISFKKKTIIFCDLSLFDFQFFINKNSQGRELIA